MYNEGSSVKNGAAKLNLKGFAVGNGVTNWDYDCTPAYIDMAFYHGLYSVELKEAIERSGCDYGGPNMSHLRGAECYGYLAQFTALTKDVNIYDLYGICYGNEPYPQIMANNGASRKGFSARDYTPWLETEFYSNSDSSLPPCTFGIPLTDYLNQADVREAMHIPEDVQDWEMCTAQIDYQNDDSIGSMWVYQQLADKVKMLHYSGDTDGAVPMLGTLRWMESL